MHESCIGGHPGETKTINKIKKLFYWPGLAEDIKELVMNLIVLP